MTDFRCEYLTYDDWKEGHGFRDALRIDKVRINRFILTSFLPFKGVILVSILYNMYICIYIYTRDNRYDDIM